MYWLPWKKLYCVLFTIVLNPYTDLRWDIFLQKNNILHLFWHWILTCYMYKHTYWCLINTLSSLLLDRVTHLPLDKMAAILADNIFKHIFLTENIRTVIEISLKFVPRGLIYNTPALVKVMAWRRTGDKPLPEAMMTQFANVCMWH